MRRGRGFRFLSLLHPFLLLFYLHLSLPIIQAIPYQELQFLHQLYNQTNGKNWNWKPISIFGPRWDFTVKRPNPCNTREETWQGITCTLPPNNCRNATSLECKIIRIDLDTYGLQGQLLSDWTPLTTLLGLSLAVNLLTGPLPKQFPLSCMSLWLSRNRLTGPIPIELTKLSSLSIIHLEVNSLTGRIPSDIGNMFSLRNLFLSQNSFYGTIPTSLSQLTSLLAIYLSSNSLTGTIPSNLNNISSLLYLVLDNNSLTGTIPDTLSLLSSLYYLDLDQNYLTGSLSSNLFDMTRLGTLSLDSNLLSSSLPCNIHHLESLIYLDLDSNYFTGLCSNLQFSSKLISLDLADNMIISLLEPNYISTLSLLQFFDIHKNYFYENLPNNFHHLSSLLYFHGSENLFSGSLPSTLHQLVLLEQLYLNNNYLTGSLNSFMKISRENSSTPTPTPTSPNTTTSTSNATTSTSMDNLMNLDLSNNQFTDIIPSELFINFKLQMLSLSLNCFHGTIPSTICLASQLETLSLDGLGASKYCDYYHNYIPSLYNNKITGNIPSCIWEILTNITQLSLAGNGLTGKLSSLSSTSSLVNLTISHNHLSGTIPISFYLHNFYNLDLSYNKFSGEYHYHHEPTSTTKNLSNSSSSSDHYHILILEVNRLSGTFSSTINNDITSPSYSYVNLLTGNIFSCDYLPKEDINFQTYRCGSRLLDYAMLMLTPLFIIILILFLYSYLDSNSYYSITIFHSILQIFRDYSTPTSSVRIHEILQINGQNILKTLKLFIYLEETVKYIDFTCLITTIPLYLLRVFLPDSSTHTHLYRWTWTTAYFKGLIPSCLLLSAWIIVVTVVFSRIRRLKDLFSSTFNTSTLPSASSSTTQPSRLQLTVYHPYLSSVYRLICSLFVILINICVMGTVNTYYVIASNDNDITAIELFFIQFSFACCNFFWSKLCLPILVSTFSKDSHGVYVFVLVINSVFIPSIVIALTSPACFQVYLIL